MASKLQEVRENSILRHGITLDDHWCETPLVVLDNTGRYSVCLRDYQHAFNGAKNDPIAVVETVLSLVEKARLTIQHFERSWWRDEPVYILDKGEWKLDPTINRYCATADRYEFLNRRSIPTRFKQK